MDVFSTVPAQTLRTIAVLLLPDALFSLALTCKTAYQYLHDLVEAQREFANKYSLVDTRHPLSAVTALRKILTDPTAAWHLRSINMWRSPWGRGARKNRTGENDVDCFPYALEYPHVWSSSAYKQVYKRVRERWRDFSYLEYGVNASGEAISGGEFRKEAFISDEESNILESLLQPFNPKFAALHTDAGGGCPAFFLLIACAPRLRHVWHARSDGACVPWDRYLRRFFEQLDSLINEQRGSRSIQDSQAPLKELKLELPPGFLALQNIDLGEETPFFKCENYRETVSIDVLRDFLLLPNLELLRFAHTFRFPAFEDLQYIFEWEPRNGTLRESRMTFTDEEKDFSPFNQWEYWPMKVLSTVFGNRITSYECSTGTVQDVQALHLCSAQILESLTFTDDTPEDLRWLLGRFSNLKALTVGIDYLTRHDGAATLDSLTAILLPASLEHLMIHSESHAKKRPREGKDVMQWAETMRRLGAHLILKLYLMLASDQLPNLQSMCLVRTWGETTPDQLDSLVTCAAERRINLHLWSGSPDPDARTCAHLCGRFVPTEKEQIRWPHGPRSWNFYSTYNWVTGRDELQYGDRYPCKYPRLDHEPEMQTQFLHEWNEDYFKDRLRELYNNPNEVDGLADLNFAENGLDFLGRDELEMLAGDLCERYKIEDDKARRVRESMDLGRKVVDQLGGEGGRLVCRDFRWQRVYD